MVSDTTLRDIKFTTPEGNQELPNVPGVATGAMVVSNHSPYKGDIQYNLPGGLFLILPASLVNDDLDAALADGIGYNKGENGVLIGNFTGGYDEAGSHFSYRLKCNSDK